VVGSRATSERRSENRDFDSLVVSNRLVISRHFTRPDGGSHLKTVAAFEIKNVQFLDPDGNPTKEKLTPLAYDLEQLCELYQLMTQTRIFDAKAIALQRTGKLGTYASSLGHEAIHVGIGSAMRAEDVFAPMYREYGAMFYRGVKMSDVLKYWGGDERGSDYSGPRHDFPICVPIATQCLHAAGAAFAFQLRNEKRCAVTIVGDGGSSKGDFLEALNAAGAFKLPVVFVIANNQWAISIPRSKQSGGKTLAQKGLAAGLPCIQVDGNDLVAMRWAMDKALERAREGKGAFVIEAMTYRLSDHTTADDARRYRPDDEVDEAWTKEPLIRLRKYLTTNGIWNDEKEEAMKASCSEKVEQAVAEYTALETASVESIFDHMFAELPHDLAEQRAYAMEVEND
jgi:2-oxoisovalerate dehydrogenase E1 component alpha subunit